MAGGRPREHDLVLIADRLVEWAKRDDSINLNKFCCTHDPILPPTYIMRWAREDSQFCLAYDKAKAFLAARREEKLGSDELHVKAYDLNATVYDQFLKDEKRAQAEFESSLKQKEAQAATQDDLVRAEKVVEQLDKLQQHFQFGSPPENNQ